MARSVRVTGAFLLSIGVSTTAFLPTSEASSDLLVASVSNHVVKRVASDMSHPHAAIPDGGELVSVSALSSTDVWAVGDKGGKPRDGSTTPLIEHWDGTTWTTIKGLQPLSLYTILESVDAISATDVWAVGAQDARVGDHGFLRGQPLIEHWDGSTWSELAFDDGSATNEELLSVNGVSADDVWVSGTSDGNRLLAHWDGTEWTMSQGSSKPAEAFGDLSMDLPSDGWTLDGGLYGDQVQARTAEHWTGGAWETSKFAFPAGAISPRVAAIRSLAPDDAWAVGVYSWKRLGEIVPLIEHWDGHIWTAVASPVTSDAQGGALRAVDLDSPDDGWALGANRVGRLLFEHWNGTRWTRAAIRTPSDLIYFSSFSVAAISPTNAWAVSGGICTNYVGCAFIEHWDGAHWKVFGRTR